MVAGGPCISILYGGGGARVRCGIVPDWMRWVYSKQGMMSKDDLYDENAVHVKQFLQVGPVGPYATTAERCPSPS